MASPKSPTTMPIKCPPFKPDDISRGVHQPKKQKGKKSNKAAKIAKNKAKRTASERQDLNRSAGTAMGDASDDDWCCDRA